MTSQSQRPTPVCARRIRIVWSSVGALLLFAAPALCDTIRVNSFDSWRWTGFSWSAPPVDAVAKLASTSSSSSYSGWRFGGTTSSTTTLTQLSSTADILSSLAYSALKDTDVAASVSNDGRLAGYVYVDSNNNGLMETTDWAIAEAKIELTGNGATAWTYSDKDGSYNFNSLAAGIYAIAMKTPCVVPGKDTAGQIYDKNGAVDGPKTSQVAVAKDLFSNIELSAGYTGTNFNFAELGYPIDLVSKRMLIGNDPGIIHTVPEPGALVLLTIASACFSGLAWRRRRR